MCGLFGGASQLLIDNEVSAVFDLGLLSQFRGSNSTGLAVISRNEKGGYTYGIRKRTEPSGFYLNTRETHEWVNKQTNPVIMLGHTRAATTGALTKTNAHPFHFGDIVGVHNGQMGAYNDPNEEKDGYEKKSDSYRFYEAMAKDGLKPALERAHLDSTLCAYALMWINIADLTLNVVRNKERPLWFVDNTTGNTTYWASEKEMLDFMARRSNTPSVKTPFQIAEDTLYTWSLYERKWTHEKLEIQRHRAYKGHNFRGSGGAHAGKEWWDSRAKSIYDWEDGDFGEYPENDPSKFDGHVMGPVRKISKAEKRKLDKARAAAVAAETERRNKQVASNVILLPNAATKPGFNDNDSSSDASSDLISIAFLTADDKDYWYVAYGNQNYDIPSATKLLNRAGSCLFCTTKANVNTPIYWKNPRDFLCKKCFKSGVLGELDDKHKYQAARLVLRNKALFS